MQITSVAIWVILIAILILSGYFLWGIITLTGGSLTGADFENNSMGVPVYLQSAWTVIHISHSKIGCEGIEIYSQDGFENGIWSIKLADNNISNIKSPLNLLRYGGDCKSRSQAAMCLCEVFNRTCQFYMEFVINKHFDKGCSTSNCSVGHVGVEEFDGQNWNRLI